ncbi:MAG: hypothetical protein KGI38_11470 [Thaumarchaeota archaeon]|nr:hypothetical protein [Nitrososphaerota archaeon]
MNVYAKRIAISNIVAAVLVIAFMVAAGAATYAYVTSQVKPGSSAGPTTSAINSAVAAPNPLFGLTVKSGNTLTAASMSETNPAYNFFSCSTLKGSSFSALSTLYGITPTISALTKGTQSTTTLAAGDFSCGFGVITVYAGDATYTDTSKVLGGGNGVPIAQYRWLVATSQGRSDLAVDFLYSALGSPNYAVSVNLAMIFTNSEFVQTTIGSVTVTTANAEIGGISTNANTVQIVKWTIGAVTSTDAIAIAKIVINSNDSTTAPVIASYGAISFGDVPLANWPAVSGSNFIFTNGVLSGIGFGNAVSVGYSSSTVTYQYNYWPGATAYDNTQVANALMVSNPAQSVGDTTISIPITLNLGATGTTNVGLSVTLISGAGAQTIVTTSSVGLEHPAT